MTIPALDPPCEILAWDSDFWGVRVARVTAPALAPGDTERIDAWCRRKHIGCLYLLAPSNDHVTVREAEAAAFSLVDVRLILEVRQVPVASDAALVSSEPHVRPHHPADLADLKRIASTSHRDSRFYFDGRFPRERCDALYATWIRRSCEGWADAVFVSEVDGLVAGYVSCHIDPGGGGRIGIIGVGERARGRGVGQGLVRAALGWFAERGATVVSVVTQGRNVQAQRLYQRCGFVTASVHLWYHRWSDGGDAP